MLVHIGEVMGEVFAILSGPRYEAVRKEPCRHCKDDRYNKPGFGGCWNLSLCSSQKCPFFRGCSGEEGQCY